MTERILRDDIHRDLKARYDKAVADDGLPSKETLTRYRERFLREFGPETLRRLEGEALLNKMHDHSDKDSLVYWLEYKNDEEFVADVFGGIGGGSALKFGIYRRKATGAWTSGSPQAQREVPTAEAIAIAERHRDQLLAGFDALRALPPDGDDDAYARLEQELARVAPNVADTAWGHKYLAVLFPDKLDDFHNSEYQRHHLIRILVLPPTAEGRYVCAGRFVRLAHEIGIPVTHASWLLNARNGPPRRYWRVGVGDSDDARSRWAVMRDGGFAAVGWQRLGDLSELAYDNESKQKLRGLMAETYPGPPQAVGRQALQVFRFVTHASEGDIVLACAGATVLGLGRISGAYRFGLPADRPHQRPVDWLDVGDWKMPEPEGLRTTWIEVKKPVNLVAVEARLLDPTSPPRPVVREPDPHIRPPTLDGHPGRIAQALERKGQVILYGPPGTGKTFWAVRTVRDLASWYAFGKLYADLAPTEKPAVDGRHGEHGLVRQCTFHPAVGYEEFIEGYRPTTGADGGLAFELRDGIFRTFCADAERDPARRYYLVIDEINRGDIPRIFGELLTLLEKGKRSASVSLPVSGKAFSVPANVFVVGTMNTADRSIALLDTALRRRFAFIELMPDPSVLEGAVVKDLPLDRWLRSLNERICRYVGRDARNLQIGHSYLMDGDRAIRDTGALRRALVEDILPLLEEYCYEDYDSLEQILGKKLVDRDRQCYRREPLMAGRDDDLIDALRAADPDLPVVGPAAAAEADQEAETDVDDGAEGTSA